MAVDIGTFIFVDLLGMTMYPGYPFTGVIVRDAIQFLFIPSVFIILVIYMLVGRLAVPGHKIRIMIAVAAYLFIISGGYYKIFALLAGPYFIFLIFILGLLYFIPAHFGGVGGGHAHSGRALAHAGQGAEFLSESDSVFEDMWRKEIQVKKLAQAIEKLSKNHSPDAQRGVAEMYSRQAALEAEIQALHDSLNRVQKSQYESWFKAKKKFL